MTEKPVVLQIFTLPNTIDGRLALKLIRTGLNRKDYEIVVRNRGTKGWVKLHDRFAAKWNRWIRSFGPPVPKYEAGPEAWNVYNADMRKFEKRLIFKLLMSNLGRDRYGITRRYAARMGIYIIRRRGSRKSWRPTMHIGEEDQ